MRSFRALLLVLIIVFAVLTYLAKLNPYFPFDLVITRSIQSINLAGFDLLMRFLTTLGNHPYWEILVFGSSIIFWLVKLKKEAIITLVSSIGVLTLSELIKRIVARPRPDGSLVIQIEHFTRPDSFPSGHVLFFMGFFGFLLFVVYSQKSSAYSRFKPGILRTFLICLLGLLLILIGISRIYLGAHWFSDTLGSYLLGIIWLYLMVYIYRKY